MIESDDESQQAIVRLQLEIDRAHVEDYKRKLDRRKQAIILEFLDSLSTGDNPPIVISLFNDIVAHGWSQDVNDYVLHIRKFTEDEKEFIKKELEDTES